MKKSFALQFTGGTDITRILFGEVGGGVLYFSVYMHACIQYRHGNREILGVVGEYLNSKSLSLATLMV